jgi:hypothetical protein
MRNAEKKEGGLRPIGAIEPVPGGKLEKRLQIADLRK